MYFKIFRTVPTKRHWVYICFRGRLLNLGFGDSVDRPHGEDWNEDIWTFMPCSSVPVHMIALLFWSCCHRLRMSAKTIE